MRRLYTIFDRVAVAVTGPVIPFPLDPPAVRMFNDLLGSPNSDPGQHPADYVLMCVGEQDMATGAITPCPPQIVATGVQWLEARNREAAAQTVLPMGGPVVSQS